MRRPATLALALGLLLSGCSEDAPPSGSTAGAGGTAGGGAGGEGGAEPMLPTGIFAFNGTDVDQPYDDLAPLGDIVAGADIVGLGETLHTSGGFYAAKHRLIRYLVEEQGFRVLAMETPRTRAEATAAYVETCEGTSLDAAGGVFSVFADDNTQALFEWLCARNTANPTDPVRFFGFDVQQPEDDRAALEEFLTAVAPSEAPAMLAPVDDACHLIYTLVTITPADFASCLAALDAIEQYVADNEAAILATRGEEGLAFDRLALLGLRSWQEEVFYFSSDLAAAYQTRDTAMAEVFATQRQYRYPEDTIVWAHDYHLRRRSEQANVQPVFHALGSYLFDEHAEAYRPLAITSLLTGINWPNVGCDDAYAMPRPGSLEQRIESELGAGDYLVDLGRATSAAEPFLPPGQPIQYGLDGSEVLEDQFAGVVVLAASPGMNALFWDTCP